MILWLSRKKDVALIRMCYFNMLCKKGCEIYCIYGILGLRKQSLDAVQLVSIVEIKS